MASNKVSGTTYSNVNSITNSKANIKANYKA